MRVNKVGEMKKWWRCEWFWLIPILASFLVCYLRFPYLHNDDHPEIIEHIARTGHWPGVLEYRSAMHSLLYHTAGAGVYRLLQEVRPFLGIPPVRAGQILNLAGMTALTVILVFILRRLISSLSARIFALLVFGTSTRWIIASVTIDNDTMMAVAASLALYLTIVMMKESPLPSWRIILVIGALTGLAVAFKENGLQFFIPLMACLFARHRIYGEALLPLWKRSAVLLAMAILVAAPIHLRHYRDTGKLIYHDQGFHQANWSGTRWEFSTFRFGEILRRPYIPYTDVTDERLCPADLSWPSKIYINWWSLPDFLPDRPPPGATAAIFVSALPLTCLFLIGLVLAVWRSKSDPGWLPPLGWFGVVIFFMLAASVLFPEPRWGCHTYPRHVLGDAGGIIPMVGLAYQRITDRWPWARFLLYIFLAVHLLIFWRLLLSGPFYSLASPWPGYRM